MPKTSFLASGFNVRARPIDFTLIIKLLFSAQGQFYHGSKILLYILFLFGTPVIGCLPTKTCCPSHSLLYVPRLSVWVIYQAIVWWHKSVVSTESGRTKLTHLSLWDGGTRSLIIEGNTFVPSAPVSQLTANHHSFLLWCSRAGLRQIWILDTAHMLASSSFYPLVLCSLEGRHRHNSLYLMWVSKGEVFQSFAQIIFHPWLIRVPQLKHIHFGVPRDWQQLCSKKEPPWKLHEWFKGVVWHF